MLSIRLWILLTHRLAAAVTTAPSRDQWFSAVLLLLLLALTALPAGFRMRFLRFERVKSWRILACILTTTLLFPAIAEESIFRVALLPLPSERAPIRVRLGWSVLSLLMFVASHLFKGTGTDSPRRLTFREPAFLLLATLLGLACTASYFATGSLWPPVLIHWATVAAWLGFLGGYRRLATSPSSVVVPV